MRYLIDTDWIVDGIAGKRAARQNLVALGRGGAGVSIVSLGELYEGAHLFSDPATRLDSYRRFLLGYAVLNLSEAIVEAFAEHRARLRQRGEMIPDLDLLIAATALVHDLTLVTRNRRHFARIPALRLPQPPGAP